jgi:hypothetical protein
VQVTPDGVEHAVGDGSTVVQVSSHGITATDSVVVSVNAQEGIVANEFESLFDVYPGSVSLIQGVGLRQIVVDGSTGGNDSAAAAGTQYFVQDPTVATVTPDGLIVAGSIGKTVVTVIRDGFQKDILVEVDPVPAPGPQAMTATDGGIAQDSTGATV